MISISPHPPSASAERVSHSMEALVGKPGCIEADAAGGLVDRAAPADQQRRA